MIDSRIATGVKGLDEIMHGGFLPSSSYLLVGGPGTGKTVLSLQFLNESAKRGASCLYITFAEPERAIRRNAASFECDLSGVTILDYSRPTNGPATEDEYTVFPPAEVEQEPIWKRLHDSVEERKPERLVIDSASFLRYLSTDEYQYRKQIQRLVNRLTATDCVALLLFDPVELGRESALALAVDGVITLRNDISRGQVVEIRTVEINKFRGSSFLAGLHPMRITGHGMAVWPHRVESFKEYSYERKTLPSGIQSLDELLLGGIPAGTCTLISGPSGVGKTTLATQFLVSAAREGLRGVIYTFDESSASILQRSRAIGLDLEDRLEAGSIMIREINPLQLYPDEFLEVIRGDVENNGVQVIVLDSIRGYNLAMEEFGNLVAHMQNVVNYLHSRQVSTFIISEQEKLTGDLQISDLGISHIADNVLLIRYAEYHGKVIKVINCLKKRLGAHLAEIRGFNITSKGIVVGTKLDHLQGLLTGTPIATIGE